MMIWCVEDETSIREIEIYALRSAGLEACGLEDGQTAWERLRQEQPELMILDVMMPEMDGVELLRRMKEAPSLRHIPVIMATAKGTEYDKIQSLDIGADDYLVKPFGMMEMLSRVKAVLRRCAPRSEAHLLEVGPIAMNLDARTVCVGDERVTLTFKEFELLRLFLAHPGMAFTREQIFSAVWAQDYCGETRTLDMHIRTLRQKLGSGGAMIETVRGVGYRLEA